MTLRVEGLAPSATENNFIVVSCQATDAQGNPLGTPISDRVKVEVVSIDLVIDDISELDEATRAASMLINNDYDEHNSHPISDEAVTDNGRLHDQLIGVAPRIEIGDDELIHATLTIDGPNGQTGRYWIEVLGEPQYAQYVRVWLPNGDPMPRTREDALSVTLDAQVVDLLIEGLAKYEDELHPMQLIAHFEPDGDYASAGVLTDSWDEVDVLVGVNKWTRQEWGATGPAIAIAGSTYDTLQQLAINITGRAGDASLLGNVGAITPGKQVDVRPLLNKLEERIRQDVVTAANFNGKKARFPDSVEESMGTVGMGEREVNRVFGIDPHPMLPGTPLPAYDCGSMVKIIMARGLIMELQPEEFGKIGFTVNSLWSEHTDGRDILLEDMKNGDWTCFWNNTNYRNVHNMRRSAYISENVIKTGANLYYGWNLGEKSYAQWLELLRQKYNKGLINGGTPLPDVGGDLEKLKQLIPGYTGQDGIGPGYVKFLDIPEIAKKIFDYRKSVSVRRNAG
jgi:hypothetical protein